MLLILEVILTIFAWRKGWKWLALLPVGIVLILGLLIGFSIGISGGDVAPTTGIALFLDISTIIVLIIMIIKPKTLVKKEKEDDLKNEENS